MLLLNTFNIEKICSFLHIKNNRPNYYNIIESIFQSSIIRQKFQFPFLGSQNKIFQ